MGSKGIEKPVRYVFCGKCKTDLLTCICIWPPGVRHRARKMIKVILPDRILGISFRHPNIHAPMPKRNGDSSELYEHNRRKTRATYCSLYLLNASDPLKTKWLGDGVTVLGVGDQFCKEVGRKISMTRMMEKMELTRYERAACWEAYWNRDLPVESEVVDGTEGSGSSAVLEG